MAKTQTVRASDMAHEPSSQVAHYSLKDASKLLGKSIATVKRYKRDYLLAAYKGRESDVVNRAGSFTQQGLDQLKEIVSFVATGEGQRYIEDTIMSHGSQIAHEPSKPLEAEAFEPDVLVQDGVTPMSLAHRMNVSSIDVSRFRPGTSRLQRVSDMAIVVDRVGEVVDGTIEAMDEDIQAQQHELKQNQIMLERLQKKRQALHDRALIYEARTAAMNDLNQSVIQQAEEVLEDVRG